MTALIWDKADAPLSNSINQCKRTRKHHHKSRKGCRNCKLRSIKCDETKPECERCQKFGVNCNYRAQIPDLQLCMNGRLKKNQSQDAHPQQAFLSVLPLKPVFPVISDDISAFEMDTQSTELYDKFERRTVTTISTPRIAGAYQSRSPNLTFSSPILMHAVQALASLHDRYIRNDHNPTIAERHHVVRAASLLNQKLSASIRPSDRDALWCSCALLNTIALGAVESSGHDDAWPLKYDPSELDWMNMARNKAAVWEVTAPCRPGGLLHPMLEDFNILYEPYPGIDVIPDAFRKLCNLDQSSTAENNPYYVAVHSIAKLMVTERRQADLLIKLKYLSGMQPEFRDLLAQREPRALLIQAYWYAFGINEVWYLDKRSRIECRAVCIYLGRFYLHDQAIQELLVFPKAQCNLLKASIMAENLDVDARSETKVGSAASLISKTTHV